MHFFKFLFSCCILLVLCRLVCFKIQQKRSLSRVSHLFSAVLRVTSTRDKYQALSLCLLDVCLASPTTCFYFACCYFDLHGPLAEIQLSALVAAIHVGFGESWRDSTSWTNQTKQKRQKKTKSCMELLSELLILIGINGANSLLTLSWTQPACIFVSWCHSFIIYCFSVTTLI